MSRPAQFAAPVALLATAVLLHLRQLAGGVLYWRDSHLLYVPAKQFLAQSLRSGRLPEWWPWDGAGAPFLAQPMFSTFHPTSLFYLAFPLWTALALQDFAATLGALGGAYLLARRLGQARSSATVAAIAYGSCGYLVSLTEHTFMKLSAGTMPWYAWALLVAQARGGKWRVLPGLVLGSLLLAGDPQIAILAVVFGTAVVLAGSPTKQALVLAALSPVLAAFVGAAQLVPSVLVVPETERQAVLSMANKWPLTLADFAGFVLPFDHGAYAFAASTFVGAGVVGLAAAGAMRARRRPMVAVLVAALLVGLWLALGDEFGLNAIARKIVPFWSRLRYPIKSLALANLALGLLAGEGLGQLGNAFRRRRSTIVGLAVAVPSVALAMLPAGASAGVLATGAVSVLAFALPHRKSFAAALVAAPLVIASSFVLRVTSPDFYDPPPLARVLHEAGVGLDGPAFDRLATRARPVEEIPRADVLGAGGAATSTNGLFGLPSVTAYMPGCSQRIRRFFGRPVSASAFARLLGTWGVGFLVRDEPPPAGETPIATDPEHGLSVSRVSPSLPRAYAVRRALPVSGADEAFEVLTGPRFKPGREVLLEAAVPAEWSSREDERAVPATIVGRTPVSVELEAELPWDGFVVLNEAYFRGWTATLDDADRPVFPANGPMRAIEAPAGRHRISFRFRTPGLTAGLLLSALALLLAAAFPARRRA